MAMPWTTTLVAAVAVAMAAAAEGARLRVGAGRGPGCRWRATLEEGKGAKVELCADSLTLALSETPLPAKGMPSPSPLSPPAFWARRPPSTTPCPNGTAPSTTPASAPADFDPPPFPGYEHLHHHHRHHDNDEAEDTGGEGDPVTGGFYKVHDHKATWLEARDACESEGAHLLVLDSKAEAAAVAELLRRRLVTEDEPAFTAHAGFHADLVSVTGHRMSSLAYARWAPWEPSAELCGRVDQDAWLLFGLCSARHPFVCEAHRRRRRPPVDVTPTTPPHVEDPPEAPVALPAAPHPTHSWRSEERGYWQPRGWNDSFYKVHAERTTWEHAQWKCVQEAAHLLVLDSEAEAEALVDHFQAQGELFSSRMRVGVRSHTPVTVLGKPLSAAGYSRWVKKSLEEACVAVDVKLQLHMSHCGAEGNDPRDLLPFICEQSHF